MRYVIHALFVVAAATLLIPSAHAGKGGGKGGGGGRPSFAGGQGGGPKWSRQSVGSKPTQASGKTLPGVKEKPQHAAKSHDKTPHDKLTSKKDGSFATDSGETYNKKQKQLEIEQRNRDKRLAQAEHLRQIAERNGNENLAANADRMEAFAHDHYARRVAHLEKFGVTDPALDPGSVTDPLTDPAGEFNVLPLLP